MTETTNTCGKHAPGTCNGYGTECSPRHTPDEITAHRLHEHDQAGPEHAKWCAGPGTHGPYNWHDAGFGGQDITYEAHDADFGGYGSQVRITPLPGDDE